MSAYRAIFFDLFHTLVDVARAPGASGRYTADILGIERERWREACFGAHHPITEPSSQLEVIRTLARSLDPAIDEGRIREAAAERQRRFDHALRAVEGEVVDELQRLRRRGLRLGLISNASTDEVRAWPDSPLAPCFDAAVFSWECGRCKPEPGIYHHALGCLGVDAGEALFVGDGGSDEHAGAAAVGMDAVLITRHLGRLEPEALARRGRGSRARIAHLGELHALLEG